MRVREAVADLSARFDRGGVGQLPGAHRLAERPARDELVGDVDVARVARERVRAEAARVPQPRRRRGLALGPRRRLPSRATILSATSRPVRSSRASQTEPEPPLPSGRNGR